MTSSSGEARGSSTRVTLRRSSRSTRQYMPEEKTPLDYLSEVQDLVDLNDFMNDESFGEAMGLALKCIAKPDLPPAHARKALIQMEAYSFKFRMLGQVYMTIKQGKAGTPENKRKNVYFSVSEACHELAAALKYIVRETV